MANQDFKNNLDSKNPQNAPNSVNERNIANAQNSEQLNQESNNPEASSSTGRTQSGSTLNNQNPQANQLPGDSVAGRTMAQGGNLNANVNTAAIKSQLQGLTYPCSKEQVLKAANRQGLGDNILTALNELPNQTFNSASEVANAIKNPR